MLNTKAWKTYLKQNCSNIYQSIWIKISLYLNQKSMSVKSNDFNYLIYIIIWIAIYPNNVSEGLQVGEKAPDFKLQDQDGHEKSLEAALQDGPVLLVFLRVDWCSFCVRHLQEFQDNIQEIHEAGQTTVIAVSPQESSYMKIFTRRMRYHSLYYLT